MLEVERLAVSYGEVAALRDVSLTINKAEIITLIGGNGGHEAIENLVDLVP